MGTKTILASCLCLLLGACGGESINDSASGGSAGAGGSGQGGSGQGGSGQGGSGQGASGGSGATGGVANSASLRVGPFKTDPGDEQTQCVILDLGNQAPGVIRSVRTKLSEGSHHLIISTSSAEPHAPEPCGAFTHPDGALFIAEKQEAELVYPQGTGVQVHEHQSIALELHYINYFSDAPEDIWGDIEFELAPADTGLRSVQFLFTGELSIYLPAHTQQVVEGDYPLTPGAELVALTSHTHALGTRATIELTHADGSREMVHESTDWDSPPFDTWDPGLEIAAGDRLHLKCEYDNYTDKDVSFGTGFNDEMCFLWAHYLDPQ
ncbi:MAG: hypothetical protein KC766_38405 [Myxococcales bacterium]|nr:hypothetical protein [Myxococcales bacterium]